MMHSSRPQGTTSTDPETALRVGAQTPVAWVLAGQRVTDGGTTILAVYDHEPTPDEMCEVVGPNQDSYETWGAWCFPVRTAPVTSSATQPAGIGPPDLTLPSGAQVTGEATGGQAAPIGPDAVHEAARRAYSRTIDIEDVEEETFTDHALCVLTALVRSGKTTLDEIETLWRAEAEADLGVSEDDEDDEDDSDGQ